MAVWIIVASVAGIGLVGVGWYVGAYNRLVVAAQDLKTQWSNIKTEYQRRADLIVNLASTVKSFKKHEKETLVEVAKARGGNFGATKAMEAAKMGAIDGLLGRLMVVVEKYPDLKSDVTHLKLMDELRTTEDRINIARTDYNGTVRDYNILVTSFPTYWVAKRTGFGIEEFFKNKEGTDDAPVVRLE